MTSDKAQESHGRPQEVQLEFAINFVGVVNLALFAAIAAVAVGQLRREQGRSSALWAALAFVALTSALLLSSLLLPHIPGEGDPWPWWFAAYAAAFLVHWSVLLFLVSVRLWGAGSREATVARRRM